MKGTGEQAKDVLERLKAREKRHPEASVRRNLEQIVHCAKEALSVIENDEDPEHAENDLRQAASLIEIVLKRL